MVLKECGNWRQFTIPFGGNFDHIWLLEQDRINIGKFIKKLIYISNATTIPYCHYHHYTFSSKLSSDFEMEMLGSSSKMSISIRLVSSRDAASEAVSIGSDSAFNNSLVTDLVDTIQYSALGLWGLVKDKFNMGRVSMSVIYLGRSKNSDSNRK